MKKVLFAVMLSVIMMFTGFSAFAGEDGALIEKDRFADISGHWAREAINKADFAGIFEGQSFEPGKPVTRSEFARMLHKALGIQLVYIKAPDIKEFYDDVDNDHPAASNLYDLATLGIIDCKGSFRPDEELSREDMVHFIINSLEYKTGGNYVMIMIYPEPFNDHSEINPDYNNDFIKAQVLKLVNGAGNNMFYPLRSATRAEAVAVIQRLLDLLETIKPVEEVQVIPSAEIVEEGISMKLVINNNTSSSITINHTSGQKYDFQLLNADMEILYTWSMDKMFIMALTSTVIEPGESVEFSEVVAMEDYLKDAVYMRAFITGESESFEINKEGYEAVIAGLEDER